MKVGWKIMVAALAVMLSVSARPLRAQDMPAGTTLYVDERTGQVFVRPGRHRVPMSVGGGGVSKSRLDDLEYRNDQLRAQLAETRAQEQADQAAIAKQVDNMQPAWKSYTENFQNKFRVGALVYLDYGLYTHTGFGPQQTENINPPGNGNSIYNAFDISRVYLNFYFTPTPDWTFRFTPEIYKAVGTSPNDANGNVTGVGTNLDGDLNLRLKYAYVQYGTFLDDQPRLKGTTITLGAQPNPFIPWEEDLYQFRFVNLVPWNYISLSSSQIGLQWSGPIKDEEGALTYLDYGFGVYDNGSFRTPEQTDTKQVMVKGSIYPFGASWRYQGLGLTGFYNYGFGDVTPDTVTLASPLKQNKANFQRVAGLVHYTTEEWGVAGEYDWGRNAFTLGNLFSGSGPQDAFGTATGKAVTKNFAGNTCSAAAPCYGIFGTYGPQVAAYRAFLQNGRANQEGFAFFGHFHVPETKLTAFGMFQWFLPNTHISEDPLDFRRYVVGISYQINEFVRLAIDDQNLSFYHDQFGLPISKLSQSNYVGGSVFNGRKLPKTSSLVIPNLVPRDTNAVFANLEFSY